MFSEKKIKGKKLYELARKKIEIKREPCDIKIFNLKIISYDWPILKTEIHCSSGTYIRAIARDIGNILKCGAYLKNLKRTAIDKFLIQAHYDSYYPLDILFSDAIIIIIHNYSKIVGTIKIFKLFTVH